MIFVNLLITIEYILISLISYRWNRVDGAAIEHKLGRFYHSVAPLYVLT
jgi:hypothetical protein